MQDPNEDTQWNDILRSKGILPPKEKEVSEDDIIKIMDDTIKQKTSGKNLEDMNLDELNEKEDDIDEEDERIFEEYRRKRMAEIQEAYKSAQYGSVVEISRADYVEQVNKAGDGIWVVLHVYKQGIPLCNLINNYLQELAQKFPSTKFLKSVSSVCIPNYPDKNLPTIFVYHEGDLKKQWIGPHEFHGMNLTRDELEWMLSEVNAVKTTLEENPRKKIHDVMASSVRCVHQDSDDDDDDY